MALLTDAAAAQALPGPLADRSRVMLKPLCGVSPIGDDVPGPVVGGWDVLQLSQDEIDQLIAGRGEPVVTVVSRGGVAARSPGLTVVFNAFGDVTQDAIDGMQFTDDYYASRVMDPITVTFDVDFQPGNFGAAGLEVDVERHGDRVHDARGVVVVCELHAVDRVLCDVAER
ncbi:MAG: hypothetical protein AAF907_07315, partial [Planctomycetota bacterium]